MAESTIRQIRQLTGKLETTQKTPETAADRENCQLRKGVTKVLSRLDSAKVVIVETFKGLSSGCKRRISILSLQTFKTGSSSLGHFLACIATLNSERPFNSYQAGQHLSSKHRRNDGVVVTPILSMVVTSKILLQEREKKPCRVA